MLKKSVLLAALLVAFPAFAQNVQYVSPVTRNHLAIWNTNGVLQDGGSSADSPITSIGVTNNGGAGLCISSDRQTAAGRNQLCFGASTAGPATISLQNYGTAAAQGLNFVINGTTVNLPTGGAAFALENPPFVANHASCFVSSAGVLQDCGVAIGAGTQFGVSYYSAAAQLASTAAGTNGQAFLGNTGAAPAWATLSGDVGSLTAGGVLTLAKVNGIPFASTYTAHGVLIAQGTGQFNSTVTSNIGSCLISQGTSSDPIWTACAAGSGSAGGLNTQVQFNNSTSLAGSANLTWVSPALTIGVAGNTTGQLQLAPAGSGTGTVTIQNPSTTAAYNFNLPTSAGSLGQALLSGGGGSTAMSFGTLGTAAGGTNCSSASGTCLDNITAFSSTGFIQRTGGGTYAFSTVVPVSGGGTNLASGTSGGILGYTAAGTIASSALLTQFGVLVGGGSGATPTAITPGTAGQMLIAQTGANPSWNSVSGDATLASTGALTIANSAVTVGKQANANAWTLEGNFTGSPAAPQFSTLDALTNKASPAASDLVLIQDQAAAGAFKNATVASISSAGSVSSIAGNTGSFTLAGGATNSTNQIQLDGNYIGWGTSNCTLAASVATNLLTVALKDNAGNNPSSTSPCYINFRSSTSAIGATALVSVTGALSISTFATGATLGSSNNTAFRFWVVAFNNSGTAVLALFNASTASTTVATCYGINEEVLKSSTSISGSATAGQTYYTPNGITLTNKAIRILGYIEYNSTGLATAGTYASGPNFIQTFGSGVKPPCATVSGPIFSSTSTAVSTTSNVFQNTNVAGSITLQSAANLVRYQASGILRNSTNPATGRAVVSMFSGSTQIGNELGGNIAATSATLADFDTTLIGVDKPNTASGVTYTVKLRSVDNTQTVSFPLAHSGGSAPYDGQIILEEIQG